MKTNQNSITCPACQSTKISLNRMLKKVMCNTCNHVWDFAGRNVFISYGHDQHLELVLKIKAGLEKRGHFVWLDADRIKFGHQWRNSIYEGIQNSTNVLSFLSAHAMRDPGVCRDEVLIAMGELKGNIQTIRVEPEIYPPSIIKHVNPIDMENWEQHNSEQGEEWFTQKFNQIVACIESPEGAQFNQDINFLKQQLHPLSSMEQMCHLVNQANVPRLQLFNDIEEWRQTSTAKVAWIKGCVGSGKSTFAAQMAHDLSDRILALHFCDYDLPNHNNPAQCIQSIAFQIATSNAEYRQLLVYIINQETELAKSENPELLFEKLITQPLSELQIEKDNPYLVVIDGVDEAFNNGKNHLLELLPKFIAETPQWLKWIVTCSPIHPSERFDAQVFNLENYSTDIDNYPGLFQKYYEECFDETIIKDVLNWSEDNFAILADYLDLLHRNDEFKENKLPKKISDLFTRWSKHFISLQEGKDFDPDLFVDKYVEKLRPIVACPEGISLEDYCKATEQSESEAYLFFQSMHSLVKTEVKDDDAIIINFFHPLLYEWFTSNELAEEFYISKDEGIQMLSNI